MQNPSLQQRRNRIRPKGAPSQGNKYSKSSLNVHEKKGGGSAFLLLIFGLVLFGGLFYVDHITHSSIRHKLHIPEGENYKMSAQEAALYKSSSNAAYSNVNLHADDGRMYHLIFSTDCSEFQHWQSYLLFHTAMKVKQPGTVTRIASGCSDDEAVKAKKWHKEHVTDVFGNHFILHLTPHFSGVKDKDGKTVGDYKFFNKPFGLKHWLENGLGFAESSKTKMNNEDDVVILIDPDMILLRPITGDFSNDRDVVIGKENEKDRKLKVEHGSPFAQKYGLGAQWRTFNLHEIAGADSPAKKVTQNDANVHYPVGPPYIGTARDMYAISQKWTEFVPRVHKEYPYLLAEMYAYCIAAAHLELPYQLIDSLMISNTGAGGEGWPMVDKIPHEEACDFARHPDHSKYAVPSVIHLCQRYSVGDWFFGKRKMTKDFFECESPLMEEPPSNVVVESDYKFPPGGTRKEIDTKTAQREGFMVCTITSALNEAAVFYKKNHCNGEGNMEKTLNLAKLK